MKRVVPVVLVSLLAGALSGACGAGASETPASSVTATPAAERPAPAAASGVRLVQIGRFQNPTAIAAPPADRARVYVAERAGRVMIVKDGKVLETPLLDIRSLVSAGGEQGLLGLAFPPDHARSRLFYVYYTARDGRQVLAEFRRGSGEAAAPGSRRQLFAHSDAESNHNGGQLQFGPDGLLYIGTGDGGGAGDLHGRYGNAQNLRSPLGKILRIDPRPSGGRPFTIPAGNPFVGRRGALPEIHAYGLRNPWRFSFDRRTGDLAIADVGQDAYEEVNFVRKGGARGVNFGWRVFEGRSRFSDEKAPGARAPVLTLSHDDGYCSITGGYIVRDRALGSLYGRYLFGDYCKAGIRSTKLTTRRASRPVLVRGAAGVSSTSSFGEDARGRVYVASLSGPVYRLARR